MDSKMEDQETPEKVSTALDVLGSLQRNLKVSGGGSIGGKERVGDDITERKYKIYGKLGSEIDLPENPLLLNQLGLILSGHAEQGDIEFPDRIKARGAEDFNWNSSRLNPTRFTGKIGNDIFGVDVSADKGGGRIGAKIPLGTGALSAIYKLLQ